MRILSMFVVCLIAVMSSRVFAYDTDSVAEDLNTSMHEEFFIEAKYFFLMRLYQNTDDALSNTMPHPFRMLMDDESEEVPEPLKRMFFRSFSRTIKTHYGDRGIFSKIDAEPSSFEKNFSGPALSYKFFQGHVKIGIKPDFDWDKIPIKPVAFINIGKGQLRMGVSYNPIEETIRASLKLDTAKKRVVLRQDIKVPLDDFEKTSSFSDITYKISENKNIYLGAAFRANFHDFDEAAGMIILYGFW
ncbi:MAG: hypothetical protein Q8O83_05175 [bacterium]|nr:hypothetical protein [bacterium]